MSGRYAYTEAQRQAATTLDRSLVVTAGAGSGKTRVLVDRYLNLIDPTRAGGPLATPDQVVAITFTNKAAREMLDRVRGAVREQVEAAPDEAPRRLWQRIFAQTAAARIQTIHSFCSELVWEYPVEAGVDPAAGVLEEFTAGELLEGSARQAILHLLDDEPALQALAVDRGMGALAAEVARIYRTIRASGRTWTQGEELTLANLGAAGGAEGDPGGVTGAAVVRALFRLLTAVDREYAAAKTPAALDFEDLQLLARNLVRDHPEVRRRLQARLRYLLVDEFQDTDALQYELVSLLAGDPPGDRLFVVGDPKQSIYRFRHAEVGLFAALQDRIRECAGGVVRFAENFRSQPGLVDFVNRVFPHLMGPAYEPFVPGRASEPSYPAVELLLVERENGEKTDSCTLKEARLLAARLRAMVESREELVGERPGDDGAEVRRPVAYGDIAVLFRTRTKLKLFEAALAEQGVPYYVGGGIGFYRKLEVRDVLVALRAVDDPDDLLSLAAALRSPLFGLPDDALLLLVQRAGDLGTGLAAVVTGADLVADLEAETAAQLQRAAALFTEARALRSRLSVPESLDLLLERTGYETTLLTLPQGAQKVANLRKLRQVAQELTGGQCLSLTDFLARFQRLSEGAEEAEAALESEAADAVKLLTVHGAKGLEFPVVAVADLSRKFTPDKGLWKYDTELHDRLSAAHAGENEAELKRLLYVAVTRARDHLLLTGSIAPPPAAGKEKKPPECWLTWLLEVMDAAHLPEGLVRTWSVPAAAVADLAQTGAAAEPAAAVPAGASAGEKSFPLLAPVPTPGRQVAVTTVSELMCYAACPRRYHLRYRLSTPPLGVAPGQVSDEEAENAFVVTAAELSPVARGTVVHRVIERLRSPADLEPLLSRALAEAGVADADRREAAAALRPLLEAYLSGEEFATAVRGDVVEAEAPFFFRLAPDLLLKGAVDRIDRVSGGLRLLDFKTNRVPAERAREEAAGYYRLQLPLYASAVEEVWRQPVRSGTFVFLWPDVRVEADLSPEARERAREEAAALARAIETGGQAPRPSAVCAGCGYLPLCDAGLGRKGRPR